MRDVNRDVYNYHEKIIRSHIRIAKYVRAWWLLTRSVLLQRELHFHVFAPLRRILFCSYVQVLHEFAPVYPSSAIRLFLGCPPERRLQKVGSFISASEVAVKIRTVGRKQEL